MTFDASAPADCEPGIDEKVAFLRDRRSHADRPRRVATIETHFAWVFLTARHAYKLKKPLRNGTMDYRKLSARERGCRDELRLNRRFSPHIHLAVEPLVVRRGKLAIGRGGRIVDWLVTMRRLPDARMLDRILVRRSIRPLELHRLAEALAQFFAEAKPNRVSEAKYLQILGRQVAGNARTLRLFGSRLPQALVTQVAVRQRAVLRLASGEIAQRGSRVVEGHGDLRAEHVYLGRPVAVIDCLEFDRSLRLLDPAQEVSLLALEIEQLGDAASAARLLEKYCELRRDPASAMLLNFYMSNQAMTRAKLAACHLLDAQFTNKRFWIARTRALLKAASSHAALALRSLEGSG